VSAFYEEKGDVYTATVCVRVGDCRELMADIAPESVDCIIADPPYAQTSLGWDRRVVGWAAAARRVLKPSGSMWVFGSLKSFMAARGEFDGWKLAQDIIWEKQNGTGFATDRFRRVHEQVVHFYRADAAWAGVYRQPQFTMDARARSVRAKATMVPHAGKIGPHVFDSTEGGPRQMRSVLRVRNCHRQGLGHATPKPEPLVETLLRYSCPTGGAVLDPFAGSGTTGAVAARLGLNATLIELDKACAARAAERCAA
jgi:site-specific DNA-methyltransferase (adenine-specific)